MQIFFAKIEIQNTGSSKMVFDRSKFVQKVRSIAQNVRVKFYNLMSKIHKKIPKTNLSLPPKGDSQLVKHLDTGYLGLHFCVLFVGGWWD